MSHEYCVTGAVHTGTPVGKTVTITDRETYVTGSDSKTALIYLTDVFGFGHSNHRLLADTFAKEIPATVYLADFLEESAFSLLTPEQLKNVDFAKFSEFNNKEKRNPQHLALAEEIKSKYENIFVVAYCWGAWGAMHLAGKKGLITAVSINHPSQLDIPKDLEESTVPTLIVAPYTDPQFPQEKRLIAEEIFDKKAKEQKIFSKIAVYPGFVHGFAARGDTGDAFIWGGIEDAKTESVLFFRKFAK